MAEMKEEALNTAQDAPNETAEKLTEVVSNEAQEAAEVKDAAAAETAEKNAEEVKEEQAKPAKKPAAKKPAKTAKTAAEKKPAKAEKEAAEKKPAKAALAPQVYIQFQNQEAETAQIVEKIKKQYVSEGHRSTSIKKLQVYVKPEDNAVYYVVNQGTKQESVGKVDLF